jgi:hypothetical protein
MKKELIIALLIASIFLILPFVQAQTQSETYSGFERFKDNVKFFFSSGDGKVKLALQIREKEVNSAMNNIQNNNEEKAVQNLERARDKLQIVQQKVSADMAEEVKTSTDNMINKIDEQKNLSEEFELYKLEEKKTQTTARLVVEINGKEGQTMTREIVRNESTGKKEVRVVVRGENGEETEVVKMQGELNQINNEIQTRVVKMEMAKGTTAGGNSGVVVEGDKQGVVTNNKANGDNGLKPEVKTNIAGDGTLKNDPLPVPNPNQVNPDIAPTGRAPGDTIDDTYDDNEIVNGNCGDGVVCSK